MTTINNTTMIIETSRVEALIARISDESFALALAKREIFELKYALEKAKEVRIALEGMIERGENFDGYSPPQLLQGCGIDC